MTRSSAITRRRLTCCHRLGRNETAGQHGFILDASGYTTIDVPFAGATGTTIRGINSAGDLAGEWDDAAHVRRGFARVGGSFTKIDLPGAPNTRARAISDSGVIYGHYDDPALAGIRHGFRLDGGAYTSIDVPGARSTLAGGVNRNGDIVGVYFDLADVVHGFVLSAGVFTTIDVPGAVGTLVTGINDAEQIAGEFIAGDGTVRAFIGTPQPTATSVPSPTLLTLIGIGLVALSLSRRGRFAAIVDPRNRIEQRRTPPVQDL